MGNIRKSVCCLHSNDGCGASCEIIHKYKFHNTYNTCTRILLISIRIVRTLPLLWGRKCLVVVDCKVVHYIS